MCSCTMLTPSTTGVVKSDKPDHAWSTECGGYLNSPPLRSHHAHDGQHLVEIGLPVLLSIQHTCATIRRIVAAAIHNARCTVDEPRIPVVHSTIDPSLQLVDVVVWGCVPVFSCHCRVGLHRVQPIEEASDPLQFCWRAILTDRVWVCAEVNLGEQSIPALRSGSLAQVIIQLTEVTDTSCLDDAAAPPTASL